MVYLMVYLIINQVKYAIKFLYDNIVMSQKTIQINPAYLSISGKKGGGNTLRKKEMINMIRQLKN